MSDSETVVELFDRLDGRAAVRGFRSVFGLSGVAIELILSNRGVRMEELSQIADRIFATPRPRDPANINRT